MLDTKEQYLEVFLFLLDHDRKELLIRCFDHLLSSFAQRMASVVEPAIVVFEMLRVVTKCPVLAVSFTRLASWSCLTEEVSDVLQSNAEIMLNAFIQAANMVGPAVIAPFQTVLARITILPISTCGRLVELIALAVRSPGLALDLLLGSLERESQRLIPGRPAVVRHAVRNLVGIAIDHISEAAEKEEQGKPREDVVDLDFVPGGYTANENPIIEARFRIDDRGGTPENSAHCRLTAAAPSSNALISRVYSMDVLAISSTPGTAKFRCLHPPPPLLPSSSWKLTHCSPFVTSKTMLDVILEFALEATTSCPIAPLLTPYRASPRPGPFLPLPAIHLPPSPASTRASPQRSSPPSPTPSSACGGHQAPVRRKPLSPSSSPSAPTTLTSASSSPRPPTTPSTTSCSDTSRPRPLTIRLRSASPPRSAKSPPSSCATRSTPSSAARTSTPTTQPTTKPRSKSPRRPWCFRRVAGPGWPPPRAEVRRRGGG